MDYQEEGGEAPAEEPSSEPEGGEEPSEGGM